MDSGVRTGWTGLDQIDYALKLLQLPPEKRRRITGQVARKIKAQTRKNIKDQRSVTGKSFAKRKRKRTLKGKMVSGFGREKNFFAAVDEHKATVSWKGGMAGIAKIQQEGMDFNAKPRRMSGKKLEELKGMKAQRWQARLMNELGFRVANKEGGGKRGPRLKDGKVVVPKKVSQSWIMDNIGAFQAMIIIASLREKQGGGKGSWKVHLPGREFLPNDRGWLVALATQLVMKEFNRGK